MLIACFAQRFVTVYWTAPSFAHSSKSLAADTYSCRLLCCPFVLAKEGRGNEAKIILDVKVDIFATILNRSGQAVTQSIILKIFLKKVSLRTSTLARTWFRVGRAHTVNRSDRQRSSQSCLRTGTNCFILKSSHLYYLYWNLYSLYIFHRPTIGGGFMLHVYGPRIFFKQKILPIPTSNSTQKTHPSIGWTNQIIPA